MRSVAARRARPFEAQGKRAVPLHATEEFVEFVGGVEVGFEVAGGKAFAEIVETACEEVKGGGEDFFVG
jgi:hypothetical protein